jgi:hypothetical protein
MGKDAEFASQKKAAEPCLGLALGFQNKQMQKEKRPDRLRLRVAQNETACRASRNCSVTPAVGEIDTD